MVKFTLGVYLAAHVVMGATGTITKDICGSGWDSALTIGAMLLIPALLGFLLGKETYE